MDSRPLHTPVIPTDWPTFGIQHDLLPFLQQAWARRQRVVLASLIWVQGSSPRPVGSEMAISEDGELAGYVSGGCVEAAVALEAQQVLAEGQPRLLDYGAGSPVLDLQLSCGGRIHIFLREITALSDYIAACFTARRQRQTLVVETDIRSGQMDWASQSSPPPASHLNGSLFRHSHPAPLRLIAVGHDPVTLALLQLASLMELETWLLRPQGPEHAPASTVQHYRNCSIQQALTEIEPDPQTAIYSLTHDADIDHQVLSWGLRSSAFCVGVLGARHKRAARLEALRAAGISDHRLSQLHAPAGLALGGHSPMAIALAIMAQIIQSYHHPAASEPPLAH